MPDSGTNLRFQVVINGIEKATVGLEDLGVLTCQLGWRLRDPSLATSDVQSLPGYSPDSWRDGIPKISLTALDAKNESHIEWLRDNLKIGDEITIRILAPGSIDMPEKQRPSGKLPLLLMLRSKTNEPTSLD